MQCLFIRLHPSHTCPSKCWQDFLIYATNRLIKSNNINQARAINKLIDFGPLFHYFGQNGNIF